MSYNLPTKYLFLALLLVVLGVFTLGWYLGRQKDNNVLNSVIHAQEGKIERLTIELDNQLNYVVKIEQELASQKELVKAGIVEREELKKLNIKRLAEITKLIFRIDTLLEDISHGGKIITIHDTIYKDKDINAIVLPFSFTKKDEWMSLGGDFDNTGKLGIALKMQADVNVYTGIAKKTKEPFCIVTSPNPYLNVINVQSYKTDTYKPRTFSVAVQLGYGLILAKDPQISPYVGIGISRNLISF